MASEYSPNQYPAKSLNSTQLPRPIILRGEPKTEIRPRSMGDPRSRILDVSRLRGLARRRTRPRSIPRLTRHNVQIHERSVLRCGRMGRRATLVIRQSRSFGHLLLCRKSMASRRSPAKRSQRNHSMGRHDRLLPRSMSPRRHSLRLIHQVLVESTGRHESIRTTGSRAAEMG